MTYWLGMALVPRADYIDAAIALQRRVGAGAHLEPVLSAEGNLPHVTVYQGPLYDSVDLEKILTALKADLGLASPISVAATEILYLPTGWIFLELERAAVLENLQVAALTALEGGIDRAAIDNSTEAAGYAGLARENFHRYGYRFVGEAFLPHITLGRLAGDSFAAMEAMASSPVGLRPEENDWVFDRMTFYEIGDHGSHAAKVAEVRLGK